jgi:hypothetical protein
VKKEANRSNHKPTNRKPATTPGLLSSPAEPFCRGAIVVATLNNPREKFWGTILAIGPAGLSMVALELSSVDDCTNMVIDGEEFSPPILFFPMHRLERIEMDARQGSIPSLAQRFFARTGYQPSSLFDRVAAATDSHPGEPGS